MRPLPEVVAAAERLAALTGDLDLLRGLDVVSEVAVSLVPSVVGVSLTVVVDGEPFTVTASSDEMAALDAAQYLDGGPCITAAEQSRPVVADDVLDEDAWQLYRVGSAARGVRASLSLPLGGAGARTPGAINLYAGEVDAFRGKEQLLAEVFQTPGEEFVANADLSFMTRDAARALPERLEEKAKVDQAVGMLMAMLGVSADEARSRLRTAAGRAGTPVDKLADLVVALNAV